MFTPPVSDPLLPLLRSHLVLVKYPSNKNNNIVGYYFFDSILWLIKLKHHFCLTSVEGVSLYPSNQAYVSPYCNPHIWLGSTGKIKVIWHEIFQLYSRALLHMKQEAQQSLVGNRYLLTE